MNNNNSSTCLENWIEKVMTNLKVNKINIRFKFSGRNGFYN